MYIKTRFTKTTLLVNCYLKYCARKYDHGRQRPFLSYSLHRKTNWFQYSALIDSGMKKKIAEYLNRKYPECQLR